MMNIAFQIREAIDGIVGVSIIAAIVWLGIMLIQAIVDLFEDK